MRLSSEGEEQGVWHIPSYPLVSDLNSQINIRFKLLVDVGRRLT